MTSQQKLCLLAFLALVSLSFIFAPHGMWLQGVITGGLLLIGWVLLKISRSRTPADLSQTLRQSLIFISSIAVLRYLFYRTHYTLYLDPLSLNTYFSLALYIAEIFSTFTLFIFYFQIFYLKKRDSISIANIAPQEWATVDIYIPTYNEDIEIIRKTVLGALAIEYPANKKCVYILDDGRKFESRREELRQICSELGCVLIARPTNNHAKAGNLNNALRRTRGDLVLVLDCDHIPTRKFLVKTVGFFLDPDVAFVQTPSWFYNPNLFERNLFKDSKVQHYVEFLERIKQQGKDNWNAVYLEGSAAILRREHMLQLGGISTDTVMEACQTSIRLQTLAYKSVYYDRPMVAGLNPDKFSHFIGQQVRWARGLTQTLRMEPFLLRIKLTPSFAQRLCYLSTTLRFFFGIPRLIYTVAPTLVLLTLIDPIQRIGLETLLYITPYLILPLQLKAFLYRGTYFPIWNEIYEISIAFYTTIVTSVALINPKLGSFNVTDKKLSTNGISMDWRSVRPNVILSGLIMVSLLIIPYRILFQSISMSTILIYGLWATLNLVIVLLSLLVALEQPQLRCSHRLPRKLDVIIYNHKNKWKGYTVDVSETGAKITLETCRELPSKFEIELISEYGSKAFLSARITRMISSEGSKSTIAVDFDNLTQSQTDALILLIYSDLEEWVYPNEAEVSSTLEIFRNIIKTLKKAFLGQA